MLAKGDKLPTFKLTDHNGEVIKHTTLRGSKTLLFAFPKAMTGG